MTRSQTIAIVSAALLAALVGLALLAALLALDADQTLARIYLSAARGQMRLADVMNAMSQGGSIVQRYLAK